MNVLQCKLNTKAPKIITVDYIKNYSGISDKDWTNKQFITTSLFNPYVYMKIEKMKRHKTLSGMIDMECFSY